jgi:hypothetical protein
MRVHFGSGVVVVVVIVVVVVVVATHFEAAPSLHAPVRAVC